MNASSRTTRRIAVTGGPGSGKTTLVAALAARGFRTVPEAAIEVIRELVAEHGNEGQREWRRKHGARFQARILARQTAAEEALGAEAGPVFLDRGRHDGLAYCRYRKDVPPDELLPALEGWRYDAVFLLATLTEFADRRATGRTSTRADSIGLGGTLAAVYAEFGMRPFVVPEASVEERVAIVLARLEQLGWNAPPPLAGPRLS
ncbi:MAG: ATP-binding protein [Planctomycetota bacterium]